MAEQPAPPINLQTPIEAPKRWWEFFRPAWKLDDATRHKIVKALAIVGVIAVLWLLFDLVWWGAQLVGADDSKWEQVVQAKAILFRVKLAPHLGGAAIVCALVAFHALDHTRLGMRLLHWDLKDTEATESAKVINAAVIFSALLIVFGLLAAACLGGR